MLKIIECQVENKQLKDALVSSVQLESIIDRKHDLKANVVNECCEKLEDLVKKFIECELFETAMSLQRLSFTFINLYLIVANQKLLSW